jgi:hypothetical protein
MNDDLYRLPGQTSGTSDPADMDNVIEALIANLTTTRSTSDRGVVTTPLQTPAQMAVEIKQLVDLAAAEHATVRSSNTSGGVESATSRESSTGETVIRTAAMMTGVGPLVTGLLKLFGSNDPEPLPALQRFAPPPSVAVEAGLTRDREYSSLRYAQGGTPENLPGPSIATAQAATVQVNIQAMDSQSFLDRQDDIARAVREAMLHSHSINDIVLEL